MSRILNNNLFLGLFNGEPNLGTSLIIAISSIVAVFLILYIIVLCIRLMQFIMSKTQKTEKTENVSKNESKEVKSVEIVDEDMMVACLIATIDYTSETKKDVKLKSVKRIG